VVLAEYYGEQGGVSLGPVSQKIQDLAQAIAQAEGYTRGPGFIPYDYNNPGDLVDSATGQYRRFATADEGFQALYDKLQFDTSGASAIYHPSMTWQQFAWMWVNGTAPGANLTHPGDAPDAWAATVAGQLGVDPLSTVAEYLAS
jgi:hypothetical protein